MVYDSEAGKQILGVISAVIGITYSPFSLKRKGIPFQRKEWAQVVPALDYHFCLAMAWKLLITLGLPVHYWRPLYKLFPYWTLRTICKIFQTCFIVPERRREKPTPFHLSLRQKSRAAYLFIPLLLLTFYPRRIAARTHARPRRFRTALSLHAHIFMKKLQ